MAFSPVSNSDIDASSPLTQGLLRQFRDNLEAHNHSSGQGAVLTEASFAAASIDGDAVNSTTKLQRALGATVKSITFSIGADFFVKARENVGIANMGFTIVPDVTSVLIATFQALITATGQRVEYGFSLDGTLQKIRVATGDLSASSQIISPLLVLVVEITAGTHTLIPTIKNLSNTDLTVTIIDRQSSYRLFAAL